METVKYQWKMKGLAKGLDADQVISELESVEKIYGQLNAENIVDYASNGGCTLAELFEWDDSKAAYQHRLQQARNVLNNLEVKVVSNGKEKNLPVYEVVVSNNERQYKDVTSLSVDEVEQVKTETKKQLQTLRSKLKAYEQFEETISQIDAALETLKK
jgi:hypothetical protein